MACTARPPGVGFRHDSGSEAPRPAHDARRIPLPAVHLTLGGETSLFYAPDEGSVDPVTAVLALNEAVRSPLAPKPVNTKRCSPSKKAQKQQQSLRSKAHTKPISSCLHDLRASTAELEDPRDPTDRRTRGPRPTLLLIPRRRPKHPQRGRNQGSRSYPHPRPRERPDRESNETPAHRAPRRPAHLLQRRSQQRHRSQHKAAPPDEN